MRIQNLLAFLLNLECVAYPPCNSSFSMKNKNFELLKKIFSCYQKVKVYTFLIIVYDGDSEFVCRFIGSWLRSRSALQPLL